MEGDYGIEIRMSGAELIEIAEHIDAALVEFEAEAIQQPIKSVAAVCEQISGCWSKSNLGYHSTVYYSDLKTPPPGARFSMMNGFENSWQEGTIGDWEEMRPRDIIDEINLRSGNPDLSAAQQLSAKVRNVVDSAKQSILSIATLSLAERDDSYVRDVKLKVENLNIITRSTARQILLPSAQVITSDTIAISQGWQLAPHQERLLDVTLLGAPAVVAKSLSAFAKQLGSHLVRTERKNVKSGLIGTNVFIGHGRSKSWMVLKDFINDRLRLPYDEFNRVPVAGFTNIARLSEMLDAAAIAFIVLTAEDELKDGTLQARMNVIHEAGLFQGRLGFSRAILMVEDGCEEFSNVQGLGQIRFPAGNIAASFEDVRLVLEREGLA